MENATKALLIAAAVLIVILLIAGGVKIFSTPKDTSVQAKSVEQKISDTIKRISGDISSTFAVDRNLGEGEYRVDALHTTQTDTWDGNKINPNNEEDTSFIKTDGWHITTCAQLKYYADTVNKEVTNHTVTESTNIYLENDLNLNEKEWTPIGEYTTNSTNIKKIGNFNGKGHTIQNIKLSDNLNILNLIESGPFDIAFGSVTDHIESHTL